MFALILAYLVRFDFLSLPYEEELPILKQALPWYILIRASIFYLMKTYAGIIRYTSTQDAKRLFVAVSLGSLIFLIISPIKKEYGDGFYFLPMTIILVDYLASVFFLISSRIALKLLYFESQREKKDVLRVVIYGAGQAGLIAKRTLDREGTRKMVVVAFVDDDKNKKSKTLEAVKIMHSSQLDDFLKEGKADQLIISMQQVDAENRKEVVDTCVKYGVEVLNVPPVSTWINGELNVKQLRKIKIEDLLGRRPIRIANDKLAEDIAGKIVMVTGAAGSIGSGLARQIIRHNPKQIILLDQAESPLYEIEQELIRDGYKDKLLAVVADITSRSRMERVMSRYKPDSIYHAAAYKHVPLMELNVHEAIETNVCGTKNLVDLAIVHEVKKFVMISTDKAVNPTSVMGATKRTAEIYAQTAREGVQTKFITTRFGNVLGSNGSVIPLFRKQIERGGPLTVTHPEVTRYFMTIPEACQLVLEAGSMGEGGEIFIFDMGESVKIVDLADQMIRLSGLKPGEDIEIEFTGLRPGEKLYEELLSNEENTTKTHHPQIMIAKVRHYDMSEISDVFESLIEFNRSGEIDQAVKKIKDLVPEYLSNNSEFTKFDA